MSELPDLLRSVDAPAEMIAWAGRQRGDIQQAWENCVRADWQVWLAAVGSVALGDLILTLSAWAGEMLALTPQAGELITHVLGEAEGCVRREVERHDCVQAAELAEQAARDAPATFRDNMPGAYPELALGASWIARSAEGLMTARMRAEADRMQRAHQTAAYLGAGVSALVAKEPPVRLAADRVADDPFHAELLYVVAAAAEAATHLALAIDRGQESQREVETASPAAHATGAERIRALLP